MSNFTQPERLEVKVEAITDVADIHGITMVETKAFQSSGIMELAFNPPRNSGIEAPPHDPVQSFNQRKAEHEKWFNTEPTGRYCKATLPSGEIIGMAKWHFFLDPNNYKNPFPTEYPPYWNKGLCDEFFGGVRGKREEMMKGKPYYLMAVLTVLPEYQRKGIGQKLLEWGLRQADEAGIECWIDASPEGLGLYKKNGWREVGKVDIDLAKWGGPEVVDTTVCLVRPPQSKE